MTSAGFRRHHGLHEPFALARSQRIDKSVADFNRLPLFATNTNNETGFKIERCQGEGCQDFTQIATAGANVVVFADTGLDNGLEYTYRVRAYNARGIPAIRIQPGAPNSRRPARQALQAP